MDTALVIGGTRFIGRFAVRELLENDYDVTIFNRGNSENHFADEGVSRLVGDRTNRDDLESAYQETQPDLVLDSVAMKPEQVRTATEIFSDVGAYVYISSTHAYQRTATIPLKEGVTPLCECTAEQAVSDDGDTYGPRKAEGDRIVAEAATRGINAMSVRPTAIYGPYDYTQRQDYWIDRVNNYDQIVLPGDEFRMPIHIGYVEDVARAIRLVAERGDPGEAYNVADRQHLTYTDFIELIADALDTSVEVFHAPPNVLSEEGLDVTDFSLCEPYPYYVSTEKLASLGWESTPYETGIANAVSEHLESDRDGEIHDPGRDTETDLIARLEGSGTLING